MGEEAILTIKEAAARAKVGTQKIRRDIDGGRLKAYKVGWQWLINEGDLIEYLAEETSEANKN